MEEVQNGFVRRVTGVNKTSRLVKCVTKTSEESLKVAATARNDVIVLGKIEWEDLIATEAHYLEECRKPYINVSRISNNKAIHEHSLFQEVHKKSFHLLNRPY